VSSASEVIACFTDLFGAAAVVTGDAVRAFAIDGQTPHCAVFPQTVADAGRCAAAADRAGFATIPVGNGTQIGVGRAPRRYDVALSTRRLHRIVAHEAGDMTVTVEAGVTVAQLNDALSSAGQWLPLDPPHPETTTIGALIATNACGPLRLSQGTVRDLLIGITAVLADGTAVHGGGRVVKNVAGYDLMKLFIRSFGTLGIIAEATFKIRPLPQERTAVVIPGDSIAAALGLALGVLAAPVAPLYVEAINRSAARLLGIDAPSAVVVGLAGSAAEIDAQHGRLNALTATTLQLRNDASLSADLRDFPAAIAGDNVCGGTLSVLPSKLGAVLADAERACAAHGIEVAVLAHVGSGVAVIRWSGAGVSFAESLRASARAAGGWLVFDALPAALKKDIDPWGEDIPGLELMRGIKQTLDPNGRLSPGRFVGGI